MKVAQAEAHVISSQGLEETQVFKIRTNAHAFKILSSGLYSDKVAAVLREIGCNAHDAHIAAGHPSTRFEVKLPNQIDNQFYIKDFGTGLAHDEVMNLYTTYFASTKQTSNDFTGAFGLGSKSPFSYTDSFTITSRHDGISRVYSAHIGNDGAPNIAKMGESPCGKDTGIEISFPVNAGDFHSFQARAQSIYQYFDPIPLIVGGAAIKPIELVRDFGTYAFIKEEQGIKIQMGNVCYPVQTNELNILPSGKDASIYQNMNNLKGLLIRLKIGDVQVAASREKLQYDTASQEFIKNALCKSIYQICTELETLWKDTVSDNTWANRVKFNKLARDSRRGFNITAELLKAAGCAQPEDLHEALGRYHEQLPSEINRARYDYIIPDRNGKFRYRKPGEHIYYDDENGENITIVYGTESYARDRVRRAVNTGVLKLPVLLVIPIRKDKGTDADVTNMKKLINVKFGVLDEVKLGDLTGPTLVKKPKLKKGQLPALSKELAAITSKVYVNEQTVQRWNNQKSWWVLDTDAQGQETVLHARDYNTFLANIRTLEKILPIPPFARVGKGAIKKNKLLLRPDWKPLRQYMEEFLALPSSIDALKNAVGSFKYKLELSGYRSENEDGLLENLVHIADQEDDMFMALIPTLKKHALLDIVEEVLSNSHSQKGLKPLTLVAAYKELADAMQVQINVPEFDEPMVLVNVKFPHAAKLPYRVFTDLWRYAPDRLPDVLDQLLKKG